MAQAVESKIKEGKYASVSEVMRDVVRALLERDAAVERWLREEVVAATRNIRPTRPGASRARQSLPTSKPAAPGGRRDEVYERQNSDQS